MPSLKTLVGIRVSGPSRESAVEVVNSFMFEASGRGVPAALPQTDLASFGLDHDQPAGRPAALAQPAPASDSQAVLACALARSSRAATAHAAASRTALVS